MVFIILKLKFNTFSKNVCCFHCAHELPLKIVSFCGQFYCKRKIPEHSKYLRVGESRPKSFKWDDAICEQKLRWKMIARNMSSKTERHRAKN